MRNVAATWRLLAAAGAVCAGTLWAAPRPSEVRIKWEIEIDYRPPQVIQIPVTGTNRLQTFWYMRFRVTNRSGADQVLIPDIVLYTDTGQLIRAGQRVPMAVFRAIQKLHNDPFLKDTTSITGKILQGADNSKDGVAIWPDFDPKAGTIDIFIGGLSGESAEVVLPTPVKVRVMGEDGKMTVKEIDRIVLVKTLRLRFDVPGEAGARAGIAVKQLKEDWVMR